ncbi:hypothetical protein GJ496_004936 [Pomphorhynchus laevis]|nr:hypothetical protein GJ496_004936 [Pomphorhynchus laevis]
MIRILADSVFRECIPFNSRNVEFGQILVKLTRWLVIKKMHSNKTVGMWNSTKYSWSVISIAYYLNYRFLG